MSTTIIPVPPHHRALALDVRPGDWISSDAIQWHLVLAVDVVEQVLTVGEPGTPGHPIPVTVDATVLRLSPAHAPRRRTWSTPVQTPQHDTDNKINGPLPGESDENRSL